MLRVLIQGIGIAAAALIGGVALVLVFSAGCDDGKSSLLVVNQGSLPLAAVQLVGSDGDKHKLKPVGPGDSLRFELRGLREEFYSAEVIRSNGSGFRTAVGRMVSDNIGVDDTVFVSDSAFTVQPVPNSAFRGQPVTWPAGAREP